MQISKRKFLTGLAGLVAAPAVVRVIDLMPVKSFVPTAPVSLNVASSFLTYEQFREISQMDHQPKQFLIENYFQRELSWPQKERQKNFLMQSFKQLPLIGT